VQRIKDCQVKEKRALRGGLMQNSATLRNHQESDLLNRVKGGEKGEGEEKKETQIYCPTMTPSETDRRLQLQDHLTHALEKRKSLAERKGGGRGVWGLGWGGDFFVGGGNPRG